MNQASWIVARKSSHSMSDTSVGSHQHGTPVSQHHSPSALRAGHASHSPGVAPLRGRLSGGLRINGAILAITDGQKSLQKSSS